jgi:sec-independent protein translocase protein TatB
VFNLGMGEITVILLLALIFLGPSKLPELASGLGRIIREIRKATSDVKNEIALDDSFRKPFEELRDAVTLHPDELKRRDQLKQSLEEARKRAEAEQQAAAGAAAAAETAGAGEALPPGSAPTAVPAPPAPAVPEAPPVGTVARRETAPTPPPPTHLGPPRVTPPISSVASDRANVTQVLSEADIMSSAAPPPPPGAPPPAPAHHLPPPLPGIGSGPTSAKKT